MVSEKGPQGWLMNGLQASKCGLSQKAATYAREGGEARLRAGDKTPLGKMGVSLTFSPHKKNNGHSMTGTGCQRKSKKNNHIIGYF